MSAVALPVHPITGLTALDVIGGRPVWPVMGGSGDDPVDPPKDLAPEPPKPADPPPAPPTPDDKGFPENTPVAEMSPGQQAAYWRHQARKHEDRAKAAPTAEELAELRAARDERDQLRQELMTESEKAIEAAKQEGRQAAAAEFGERLVAAEFTAAAAGRQVNLDALLTGLDRSRFLKDGEPDRDAIKAFVDAIAPAEPQQPPVPPRGPDLEQGYRTPPTNKPTTASGSDLYAAWAGKK